MYIIFILYVYYIYNIHVCYFFLVFKKKIRVFVLKDQSIVYSICFMLELFVITWQFAYLYSSSTATSVLEHLKMRS